MAVAGKTELQNFIWEFIEARLPGSDDKTQRLPARAGIGMKGSGGYGGGGDDADRVMPYFCRTF